MKTILSLTAMVVAMTGTASAQLVPPTADPGASPPVAAPNGMPMPPMPGPSGRMHMDMGQMRATMQQMGEARKATRTQMLAALTPTNRTQLGAIVAGLATSASPDEAAAIKQLNGMLSAGESQAILVADQAFRDKMRAMHPPRAPRPDGSARPMPVPMPMMTGGKHDAGSVLLHMAMHFGHPPMMMAPGATPPPR